MVAAPRCRSSPVADPLQVTCKLYARPSERAYETSQDFVFGDTVRFTADDTDFVLDTSGWPRLA